MQLAALWIGWCVLHSLLITAGLRQWIGQRGGIWSGLYRLVYVGVAIATLLPLLVYTAALPQHPLGPLPIWVRGLQVILLLYALVMFVGGLRAYDLQSFLGLRQWRCYREGKSDPPPFLNTTGILGHLRHPWYSGGIALLWGLPSMTDVTLVSRSILTIYLVIGAFLEERKMHVLLGARYRAYCRQTPMFFPWRFGRRDQP